MDTGRKTALLDAGHRFNFEAFFHPVQCTAWKKLFT